MQWLLLSDQYCVSVLLLYCLTQYHGGLRRYGGGRRGMRRRGRRRGGWAAVAAEEC